MSLTHAGPAVSVRPTQSRNPLFIKSMSLTKAVERNGDALQYVSRNPLFIKSMSLTDLRSRFLMFISLESRNPLFIKSMSLTV